LERELERREEVERIKKDKKFGIKVEYFSKY